MTTHCRCGAEMDCTLVTPALASDGELPRPKGRRRVSMRAPNRRLRCGAQHFCLASSSTSSSALWNPPTLVHCDPTDSSRARYTALPTQGYRQPTKNEPANTPGSDHLIDPLPHPFATPWRVRPFFPPRAVSSSRWSSGSVCGAVGALGHPLNGSEGAAAKVVDLSACDVRRAALDRVARPKRPRGSGHGRDPSFVSPSTALQCFQTEDPWTIAS